MAIWFTSDEHYGHENIIKFCNRPFADTYVMQEELILRHNSRVGKNDTTYHLGDMFWRKLSVQQCVSIIQRLNGKHGYVDGNHEEVFERPDSFLLKQCFETIDDVRMLRHEKKSIWMSHYSHQVWPKSGRGAYHIFGHSHGELPGVGLSIDVGVDSHNFEPVSFEKLVRIMVDKGTK